MRAAAGDRIVVNGVRVGDPTRVGEVLEVHGADGAPPYVVRWEDGRQRLVFPGVDAVVTHPAEP